MVIIIIKKPFSLFKVLVIRMLKNKNLVERYFSLVFTLFSLVFTLFSLAIWLVVNVLIFESEKFCKKAERYNGRKVIYRL